MCLPRSRSISSVEKVIANLGSRSKVQPPWVCLYSLHGMKFVMQRQTMAGWLCLWYLRLQPTLTAVVEGLSKSFSLGTFKRPNLTQLRLSVGCGEGLTQSLRRTADAACELQPRYGLRRVFVGR